LNFILFSKSVSLEFSPLVVRKQVLLANLLILGIEVKDLTESGNNLLLQMNPHLWQLG